MTEVVRPSGGKNLIVKIPVGTPSIHLDHKELGELFTIYLNEEPVGTWEIQIWEHSKQRFIHQQFRRVEK